MTLLVEARHTLGEFELDVSLELGPGLTALVGPSGAGKTTVLNVIAGLVRPRRCVIRLDADTLANSSTGTWRPPHRRQIGYVFQEPRLFPHLTVVQNLAYARRLRRSPAGTLASNDVVDLMNLGPILRRYPSRLSGGERQRVALARALMTSPRLLLLDEPLASVDQAHRAEILPYLDRLRVERAIPTIYVTHDLGDIAPRAQQVIELRGGRAVPGHSAQHA